MKYDSIYNNIITHEQLAKIPTKRDITETKKLLKDFRIIADIPQFATVKAMLIWRKQMIAIKLG